MVRMPCYAPTEGKNCRAHLRWVYSRKRAAAFSLSGDRSKVSSGATWK